MSFCSFDSCLLQLDKFYPSHTLLRQKKACNKKHLRCPYLLHIMLGSLHCHFKPAVNLPAQDEHMVLSRSLSWFINLGEFHLLTNKQHRFYLPLKENSVGFCVILFCLILKHSKCRHGVLFFLRFPSAFCRFLICKLNRLISRPHCWDNKEQIFLM